MPMCRAGLMYKWIKSLPIWFKHTKASLTECGIPSRCSSSPGSTSLMKCFIEFGSPIAEYLMGG